eukprot:m.189928 g.189928  ORF g.189928 m.189928 type:complete len:286 (+) comp39425_c0_seq2:795-1652(+)
MASQVLQVFGSVALLSVTLTHFTASAMQEATKQCGSPCCPGRDGRDGRDGRSGPPGGPAGPAGEPGKPGPRGETSQNTDFYALITADLLKSTRLNNLTQIDENPHLSSFITFKPGNKDTNRLMRVTLAEPGVLSNSDQYVVTATVSHRSPISVTTDMDIYVTISDDISTIGYMILDAANSFGKGNMRACEGTLGQISTHSGRCVIERSAGQTKFTEYHTVQIKFGADRQTFGVGRAISGVVFPHQFVRKLQPASGIHLDIFRDHKAEQYIFHFVEVRLEKETVHS